MDENRDTDAGLKDEQREGSKGSEEEKAKDGGILDQSKLGQSSEWYESEEDEEEEEEEEEDEEEEQRASRISTARSVEGISSKKRKMRSVMDIYSKPDPVIGGTSDGEQGKKMKQSEEAKDDDKSNLGKLVSSTTGHDNPEFKGENNIGYWPLPLHQIEGKIIQIRREDAEKYLGLNPNTEAAALRLTDCNGQHWDIEVSSTGPISDPTLLFMTGWGDFLEAHEVKTDDLIGFYKPIQPFDNKHFLVACSKFLLCKRITTTDVAERQLTFTIADVQGVLKAVASAPPVDWVTQLQTNSHEDEKVFKFTDAGKQDWVMNIKLYTSNIEGNEMSKNMTTFAGKHPLEVGDAILIYKAVKHTKKNRYILRFFKMAQQQQHLD